MWVLSPGQRVDRYLVEAMIGAGGVAVVYRVRHTQLDTVHALKLLVTDTPSVRRRMRREARVQFALRHPNIVRVTDLLEVDGRPALIMEYVDGPTLKEWMHHGRPDPVDALRVFRVVVRAVGFAHAHGHVHRDLKPANVLLARSEDGFVPKVTDFGIVKTVHGARGGTTQQGVFMGTPEYTAPEQIRSAAQVDHRADLFALGCMLYELSCGQLPFVGHDVVSTLNAVRRGDFIEPSRLAEIHPAVDRAIHGLLKAEPERRIQSCDELIEVLEDAPGGSRSEEGDSLRPTVGPRVPPEFVPMPAAGTWPSLGSGEARGPQSVAWPSKPPPEVGEITPTRVVEAPEPVGPRPFDEAAFLGARALAHRLTLDLLAVQRGSHDPSTIAARYASAVSGMQGMRRTLDALDLPFASDLARDLVEIVEGGRREGRPLEPSTVDALIRGMDALLQRLQAHAQGRSPTRGALRELERAARAVADLVRL